MPNIQKEPSPIRSILSSELDRIKEILPEDFDAKHNHKDSFVDGILFGAFIIFVFCLGYLSHLIIYMKR